MENPEFANTSKLDKKKKSKFNSNKKHSSNGGSSDQEAFLEVKPRRSFWRNLFRKSPKKTEVPEMSDQRSGVVPTRLNAIFEEPKTPEEKDHIPDEIEEIKKTLKTISPSPPPSVLMGGIELPLKTSPLAPQDDAILDYLSDESSSSESSQISEEKQEIIETTSPTLITETVDNFVEPIDPKTENLQIKEGYSFEYESEDNSTEDLSEKFQDKVIKFDDKVEQKDADSNIVVKDLNLGNEVFTPSLDAPEEEIYSPPIAETINDDDSDEKSKNSEGMAAGSDDNGRKNTAQLSVNTVAEQPIKTKTTSKRLNGLHTSNILTYADPSPSLFIKPVVLSLPTEPVTIKQNEDIFEEREIWSQNLNAGKENLAPIENRSFVVPTTTSNATAININTERGLNDFFKLIFNQTNERSQTDQSGIVNYTVAYDPVLANFNVQCYQSTYSGENINNNTHTGMGTETINKTNASFGEEKQKVVRKRKMMSLLHDKNKMAEYLKEIEKEEIKIQDQHQNEIIDTNEYVNKEKNSCASMIITPSNTPTRKLSNLTFNNDDEKLAYLLEDTQKQLKVFEESNVFYTPNTLLTSYPDKYMEIYHLIARNYSQSFSEHISETSDSNLSGIIGKNSQKSSDSIIETKSRKFLNIDREIEEIFGELLTNVNELKEICILNGVEYDSKEDLEPLMIQTLKHGGDNIVKSILDEIVTEVVKISKHDEIRGQFGSPFSFVKEFGQISDQPGTISIQSGPVQNNNYIKVENSFEKFLKHGEIFLNTFKDEVVEYNPVPYINNNEINRPQTSENLDIDSIKKTAQNILKKIEENLNKDIIDKSKKFGPYKDRKPGESQVKLQYDNHIRSADLPEVTDSLQHIFFGDNSSDIRSEFNLVPENLSKPGTSKILDRKTSLDLNSRILDEKISKLSSVPSTDLYITGESLKFSSQNALVETLMEKRTSRFTGSSLNVEPSPEVVTFRNASVSSEFHPNSFALERKPPEINLNNFENYGDINRSIEENMKIFDEKIKKINKLNAKTVEMLSSSNFSTPEGSLSILSTITENMLEITSKSSKNSQERYPKFISASHSSLSNSENNSETNSKPK